MIFQTEGFSSRIHHVASACDILMQLKLPSAHSIWGKISCSAVRWWSKDDSACVKQRPIQVHIRQSTEMKNYTDFQQDLCLLHQPAALQISQEAGIDCHHLLKEWRSCYMCVQPDNPLNFCHGNCCFKCAERKDKKII